MSTTKRFTFLIASLLLCGVAIAQSQQEIRDQFFGETDAVKKQADELNAKILAPAGYAEGLELYVSAGETLAKGKDLERVREELGEAKGFFTRSVEAAGRGGQALEAVKPEVQSSAAPESAVGPWDSAALTLLREWDPVWIGQCLNMSDAPWTGGILPRKDVELISLAVNAACTNLSAGGTRRHIRGALEAGATREEILMILKIASLLSIHTCSLGAPILLEEAKAAGVKPTPKAGGGDTGMRQDEGRGPMECGLGRVLRD